MPSIVPINSQPSCARRFWHKAKELKYGGPDAAAAVLRKGRTDTIGVIFTEASSYALTDPVVLSVLQGIARETEEAEIRLLLIPTAANRANTSWCAMRWSTALSSGRSRTPIRNESPPWPDSCRW